MIDSLLFVSACFCFFIFILGLFFAIKYDSTVLFIYSFLIAISSGLPSFSVITESSSKVEYEVPTIVSRTNNTTHVVYVGEFVYSRSYNSIEYWTATNIMVRVEKGKNIWGMSVVGTKIVLGKE
jgi:hypothetical protein